ncbi:hypothetical protein C8R43DRAFT_1153676 [Mycena crocata]|nr:hypothetical protein C8R43DRAFT_1153676 [Mycena crocata]
MACLCRNPRLATRGTDAPPLPPSTDANPPSHTASSTSHDYQLAATHTCLAPATASHHRAAPPAPCAPSNPRTLTALPTPPASPIPRHRSTPVSLRRCSSPHTAIARVLRPPLPYARSSSLPNPASSPAHCVKSTRRVVLADPCAPIHAASIRASRDVTRTRRVHSGASSPSQPAPQMHYRAIRTEQPCTSRIAQESRRVGLGRRIRAHTAEPAYPSRIGHSESPTHGHSTPDKTYLRDLNSSREGIGLISSVLLIRSAYMTAYQRALPLLESRGDLHARSQ